LFAIEWPESENLISPDPCKFKIGAAFLTMLIVPFVDHIALLIEAELTVSLALNAKLASDMVAVPSTTRIIDGDLNEFVISYAIYFSPSAERLRIESFLFNNDRRILALLVVFHDLFRSLAFLILSIAGILFTVLPEIL
jgi:hypothetical protein